MSDDRRKSLIVGNLPEETVAALQDARMPNDADEIERLTAELKEATEIIKLQLRGNRTSADSVRAFAFVDKHSEG